MSLFMVFLIIIVIIKMLERSPNFDPDNLGSVVGTATDYAECPVCANTDCQTARGRGEVIVRSGTYVVRQYHICQNCNTRALWHRRLDQFIWTVNRSGVVGGSYVVHG